MNLQKSERVREATERLYAELQAAGIEVLLDDRDARPGVMFADMELIGIPHRIVVGERGLDARHARVPARAARRASETCRSRRGCAVPRGASRGPSR